MEQGASSTQSLPAMEKGKRKAEEREDKVSYKVTQGRSYKMLTVKLRLEAKCSHTAARQPISLVLTLHAVIVFLKPH